MVMTNRHASSGRGLVRRTMSFAVLVVCVSACGSSRSVTSITPGTSPRIATTTSTSTAPDTGTSFCDLYRRDASDGRLRNWDLNDNAATPSYTETLRALDNAAPSGLKSDIARILVHYEA